MTDSPETRPVTVIDETPEETAARRKHEKRVGRYGNRATAMIELPMRDRLAMAKSMIVHGARGAALTLFTLSAVSAGVAAVYIVDANPSEVSTFHPMANKLLVAAGAFWAAVVPPAMVHMLSNLNGPTPREFADKNNERFVMKSHVEHRPVGRETLFRSGPHTPPPPQ